MGRDGTSGRAGAADRRKLPSVDALLRSEPGRRGIEDFGRPVMRQAIREALEQVARPGLLERLSREDLSTAALTLALERAAGVSYGLSHVVNATGVVLHTGLGRAPLPEPAVRAVEQAARGYVDLEVDRASGKRHRRTRRAEWLLRALTGADAALVVNNNAGALLLLLAALAKGKQVLVSRGELVEIGGEFRLPDIMAASGAKLVEVGTTNRTRVADFERAVTPKTGLILKVHPSNFRVVGFAQAPAAAAVAKVAASAGVPFAYDLGSGLLDRSAGVGPDEPTVAEALRGGADLVCFSGDKLLGGPQAGIVLGRDDLVERLRRHPVARAVRVDRLQVAALVAVLTMYSQGRRDETPTWRAIRTPATALARRARALAKDIPGATAVRTDATVGGGSVPGQTLPSWAVRLPAERPEVVAGLLRWGRPPVFGRVEDDAVLLDLRAVQPDEDAELARAVRYALSQLAAR